MEVATLRWGEPTKFWGPTLPALAAGAARKVCLSAPHGVYTCVWWGEGEEAQRTAPVEESKKKC